jgi:hypothetical protein
MRHSTNGDEGRIGATPTEGVPIVPLNVPDSGQFSAQLHGQAALAAGGASSVPVAQAITAGGLSPDQFLDALADKVSEKIGNGNGNGSGAPPPKKSKILGIEIGDWAKQAMALFFMGLLAFGAWQLSIRDELKVRPTAPQVEKSVKSTFDTHNDSSGAHPPIQVRLDGMGAKQEKIRESQIRQETLDEQQTKSLEKIEKALTTGRRGR